MVATMKHDVFFHSARHALAVLLIGLALGAAPAAAQDLAREIQNIKRDLADLQRYIYNGQSGAPPNIGAPAAEAADVSGDAAARLQVRLQDLEGRLRDMTGKLEETQFKTRQLEQRLDTALADIDYRLTVLEGGDPTAKRPGGGTSGATASTGGQAQQLIPVPGQASSGGGQGTTVISSQGTQQGGTQQPQGGTLGTLIVDAQGNIIGGKPNPGATVGSGPVSQSGDSSAPPPAPATVQAPAPVEGGDLASANTSTELPEGAQPLYDYSLGLMRQGQYADAENALRVFLDRHSDSNLVGAALYWLGETHYVRENYRDAAFAFVDVYGKHKTSPKAPDSLLKLGMSLNALGNTKEACTAFATLQSEFPNARRAVLKLAEERAAQYGC